jgi:D-tyrosyl-tRNA(Tyr) deacylase
MKAVLQRVSSASVSINSIIHSKIDNGLLILLGIETLDDENDIKWLTQKITSMRIFSDPDGKMNVSVKDIGGELLIVSQFTLHALTAKGNRPSFITAARPEQAIPLYQKFIQECDLLMEKESRTGIFGADMQVSLINDGPVTIIIDSKNRI